MRTKRAIIGAGCTLLLGGAAWLLWPSPSEPPKADWQRWLDRNSPPAPEEDPLAGRDHPFDHETRKLLHNDLLRRALWGIEEVAAIEAVVARWPMNAITGDDTPRPEWRKYFTSSDALGIIRSRFAAGAPMTDAAREHAITLLLERSAAAEISTRHAVVAIMATPGIFADPRVQSRMQAMQRDPDPMVAANAKRQLFFAEQHERQIRERGAGWPAMKASGKSIALLVLGGLIVTLAAVVVAVRHWHAAPVAPKPGWLVRLDADAPRTSAHWIEDLERRGQPEMAQGVRDQIAMEELLRVPVWGENELEVMLAYERLWPVDAVRPPNANRELQRRQGTSTDAAFTMATRLEYRGPVTPEVRERIKQVLLERSKGVDRYTRHAAATQLSHSGLWREPEVWARLQQMTRDPEPMVAAQARRIVHRLTARLEREAQQP